jgi:hypothetical protein
MEDRFKTRNLEKLAMPVFFRPDALEIRRKTQIVLDMGYTLI